MGIVKDTSEELLLEGGISNDPTVCVNPTDVAASPQGLVEAPESLSSEQDIGDGFSVARMDVPDSRPNVSSSSGKHK